MHKTLALADRICSIIHQVYEDENIEESIRFTAPSYSPPEGTYIYCDKEGNYVYECAEKGKVTGTEKTRNFDEIMMLALESIIFPKACHRAAREGKAGEDFRRTLFRIEMEEFALFGEKYKRRKEEEIQRILEKNPIV